MKADRRYIMLEINPERYPEMELALTAISEHEDKLFETKATFPKEFWLNLADTLKQVGYYGQDEPIREGLNFISQRIMEEIEAENRREKFKEAYESFADFIVEINERTDMDKVRKAQMIHDMACKMKLEA